MVGRETIWMLRTNIAHTPSLRTTANYSEQTAGMWKGLSTPGTFCTVCPWAAHMHSPTRTVEGRDVAHTKQTVKTRMRAATKRLACGVGQAS